ncbi:3-oxoacyl-[acyl-carrier-protein] reductase [Peptococcus simiae]|uniref:3-oxoacyl-[acyl-carrier-protein] reductase n=1 Tax=Peptococcus simiae TaxID=1643805 RepID=UPI00397ED0BE
MTEKKKTALVTGATGDIGQAIVKTLTEAGWQVLAHYHANQKAADDLAQTYGALPLQADLSQPGAASDLVAAALEAVGHIDALVNNAGVTRDGMLMKMTDEDYFTVMNANLYSAFATCRAVCRPMMRQRRGRIVNMSSVVGLMGNAAQSNYAASKAGLIGLTKSLARELAPRNITVNALAPGYIDTKMTAILPDEVKAKNLSHVPMGRVGTPADVAHVVAFLLDDKAAYITGQVLSVDGGMAM